MPCDFKLEHIFRRTSGCRLLDEKTVEFAGKQWCRFHLPMEANGKRSKKADWDPQAIQSFNEDIFKALERPRPEEKHADLSGVVFPGNISFSRDAHGNPRSLPPVLFFNAVFHGQAWFRRVTFEGIARFDGARFHGDALFVEATFGGDAWFEEATFHGNAQFDKAIFKRIAGFDKARFKIIAEFNEATFKSLALFAGAMFGGDARFEGAMFEANAQFYKATFKYPTHLDGGIVKGKADFSCEASSDDKNADTFRNISFAGREFRGPVKFTNRRFLDTTSFKKTVFHIAPEFHNCVLHEDTDFRRTHSPEKMCERISRVLHHLRRTFHSLKIAFSWGTIRKRKLRVIRALEVAFRVTDPNFRDTKNDHAARAYRTLKLAMERVRARQEEAGFYALEQKSLRKQEDTPCLAKVLPFLYEWTSDFGRSTLRPFWWLAGVQVVFSGVYWWRLPEGHVAVCNLGTLARFTLAQVARPFMALAPGSSGSDDGLAAGTALLAGLHSFLSLSLIALLLLALRWRFRRG